MEGARHPGAWDHPGSETTRSELQCLGGREGWGGASVFDKAPHSVCGVRWTRGIHVQSQVFKSKTSQPEVGSTDVTEPGGERTTVWTPCHGQRGYSSPLYSPAPRFVPSPPLPPHLFVKCLAKKARGRKVSRGPAALFRPQPSTFCAGTTRNPKVAWNLPSGLLAAVSVSFCTASGRRDLRGAPLG